MFLDKICVLIFAHQKRVDVFGVFVDFRGGVTEIVVYVFGCLYALLGDP